MTSTVSAASLMIPGQRKKHSPSPAFLSRDTSTSCNLVVAFLCNTLQFCFTHMYALDFTYSLYIFFLIRENTLGKSKNRNPVTQHLAHCLPTCSTRYISESSSAAHGILLFAQSLSLTRWVAIVRVKFYLTHTSHDFKQLFSQILVCVVHCGLSHVGHLKILLLVL